MKIVSRYRYAIFTLIMLLIVSFISPILGYKSFISIKSNIIQMLTVLPPIMIILGLIEIWIPKDKFMKYMGTNSGLIGIALSILMGSVAAGPMYASFPFTAVLIKKGVKFSNVIIFMNAWCVTKISTLLFEISSLGYKFTLIRLAINIPGIIIMGYLVNYFMSKDDLELVYLLNSND